MNEQVLKTLVELQVKYDLAIWLLNRSLVKLIIMGQNELMIPAHEFNKALERVGEMRGIVEQVETWLITNYPKQEDV